MMMRTAPLRTEVGKSMFENYKKLISRVVLACCCILINPFHGHAVTPELISQFTPDSSSIYQHQLGIINNRVYFVPETGIGCELWESDGTALGTKLLFQMHPYVPGNPPPGTCGILDSKLTVGNKIYFASHDQDLGSELWVTDGTQQGTHIIKDINFLTWRGNSSPLELTQGPNGLLYFTANDLPAGRELWATDGTEAGTRRVADINPGTSGSNPRKLTIVGTDLYFVATTPATGEELWVTDGSAAGTRLVADINIGSASTSFYEFRAVANQLFFVATRPDVGRELWVSDGVQTTLVKDMVPGSESSYPALLQSAGNDLYYAYYPLPNLSSRLFVRYTPQTNSFETLSPIDDAYYSELLLYQGKFYFGGLQGRPFVYDLATAKGEYLSTLPFPGSSLVSCDKFFPVGNAVYFRGRGSQGDFSIWRSRGTRSTTERITTQQNNVDSFAYLNEYFIYLGWTPETGEELWRFKEDECPANPDKYEPGACGCATADTDSDSDGVPNCHDGCPDDLNKTAGGICGCNVPDVDTDLDGSADCIETCPLDPLKIAPGKCNCGTPDTDSDSDGTANCTDGCPNDPLKTTPGICGCGTVDLDSDSDGSYNCKDLCPNDPAKILPGICNCGTADTDSDSDGIPNCRDECPNSAAKTVSGACGCGVSETDTDRDGTPDCVDGCPLNGLKTSAGVCGCAIPDFDSDSDGTLDCQDTCPDNSGKQLPGICGCYVADTDTDRDSTADCLDLCINDANKTLPGACGCGISEADSDGDRTPNCQDACPYDPLKIVAGICGCGISDGDRDFNGQPDCLETISDPVPTPTPTPVPGGTVDTLTNKIPAPAILTKAKGGALVQLPTVLELTSFRVRYAYLDRKGKQLSIRELVSSAPTFVIVSKTKKAVALTLDYRLERKGSNEVSQYSAPAKFAIKKVVKRGRARK